MIVPGPLCKKVAEPDSDFRDFWPLSTFCCTLCVIIESVGVYHVLDKVSLSAGRHAVTTEGRSEVYCCTDFKQS